MNKRFFLLVMIFVVMGGGTFILLSPNPKRQIEKAFMLVLKGQYEEADTLLSSQPTPIYTALYRGYIEQKRSRFEIAECHFKMAYLEAQGDSSRDLQSEIALAMAMNAFCKGNYQDFNAQLHAAQRLNPHSSALSFFEGLNHYVEGAFTEALLAWNVPVSQRGGAWMESSFETLFPSSWRKLHSAHCLIEEGNFASAREIVEKESLRLSPDQESMPLATLLLGLSYLKEARLCGIDQRSSYYKLARFYFERAHFNGQFAQEKERCIAHIEDEAKLLLSASMNSEQQEWGFDFIHILQDWKAKASIERLADCLALTLLHQKGETSILLCSAIHKEFHGSPFHLLLTEKMLDALMQELRTGVADDLFNLWAHVEQLAPNPLMAAKRVASLTSEEIFETVKKDNPSLSRTRNFLAFWEKLGRTPFERELLARDLLMHAKTFWYSPQQEKKGHNLMEIALLLSHHNSVVEREISVFLTSLFKQAESSNLISRLLIVYDAMGHFDINRQELVSKSTLANHLADAQYHYRVHNYMAAKTHAGWVLKLDPQNERALRLVGLAALQLGEYGQALALLQQLRSHDELTYEALLLSQAFASQTQAQHLCQTDPLGAYEMN